MRAEDLELRRALYASSGVLIDSEHGRARVVEPFDRPVIALGAQCSCAVRVQLRALIPVVREQMAAYGDPCPWCKKSRGWKNCAPHGLLQDLERAASCMSDYACAMDWAYALGEYLSAEKYAWGYWTDDEPAAYVRGASDDAASYSRAIMEVFRGLS